MFHYNAQHCGQSPINGPQTSNEAWRYTRDDIGNSVLTNSIAVGDGDIVYVMFSNRLIALNAADGDLLWESNELGGVGAVAISTDESTLYAVASSSLYALTTTGEVIWEFDDPTEKIFGEPTVAQDGTIYCASWDDYVYAVNADGTLKWKYQTDGAIAPLASPTLGTDESVVYVGSGDPNEDEGGTLYAINSEGTLEWSQQLSNMRVSGPVVGPNGNIYACASSRVHCLSPAGSTLWQSDENTSGSLCPALSSDGIVYAGTGQDGKLYAIDASDGSTLWSYQTAANPDYDPQNPHDPEYGVLTAPVIGADGTVYVGAVDGRLYAVDSSGSLIWAAKTGDSIVENCPALGSDGTLYFISEDEYLYAIRDE